MKNLSFLESVLKMPLMDLPVRSTLVNLSSSKILISPGSKLSENQLSSVSGITDIVAPNLLHCAGVPKAFHHFPYAKVWGVKNCFQQKPEIPWTHEISETTWPYSEELSLIPINGMPNISEIVFFHHSSKSIIVTDLCFNLDSKGIGSWIILNIFGTYKKFGISRLFLKYLKDKEAFQKSLQNLLKHDFENIIMSHGRIVEGNGKEIFIKALKERGF